MMKNNIRKYISNFKIIDLSHMLEEGIPNFPTHTKYYHLNVLYTHLYQTVEELSEE